MPDGKQKPRDAYDAFNGVDKLVSKPILGSDGAASWQEFRSSNKLLANKKTSSAPLAPLKKADKAAGFSSWSEERKREEEARQETGAAALGAGYTHFKVKDEDIAMRKKRKLVEQRIRPDDKEYFIKAKTFEGFKFDYVFTTRDTYGTGYYWEGKDSLKELNGNLPGWASKRDSSEGDEDDTGAELNKQQHRQQETSTETTEAGKPKKKKRKKAAPVIVEDPNNPLEQVQEAIRRRNERLGINGGSKDDDLPEGWEATVDPSSGKTYYFCRKSNETRWTKPKLDTLPEGWNIAKTAEGKQYYYHTSGETRWERPTL